MNKKRVLITGASGFIGSSLVEEALARGYEVTAGLRSTSSRAWLRQEGLRFLELDLGDAGRLAHDLGEACGRDGAFDFVVHNAGVTKARRAADFFTVNTEGTRNLADALIATRCLSGKFVFMSSLAAFGPARVGERIGGDSVPQPITAYGRSKHEAERYLRSLGSFPHLVFRPGAVYGPRDRDFLVLYKTVRRGWIPYIGSRRQRLSFVHVRDLAALVIGSLESSHSDKGYFVSDGEDHTIEAFNETVRKILNPKAVSVVLPLSVVTPLAWLMEKAAAITGTTATFNTERAKEFSAESWLCDSSETRKDFQFSPQYSLGEGLEQSLAWYRQKGWL